MQGEAKGKGAREHQVMIYILLLYLLLPKHFVKIKLLYFRDKDSKIRDRDLPSLIASSSNSLDKNSSRYAREKERPKDVGDKGMDRDRRSDRDRERERERSELSKTLERGRYDKEPHKLERDRSDRFIPRERSTDRIPGE